MTDDKEYKYTGTGQVTPEEAAEGAHVPPETFKRLHDNWDKIPDRRKGYLLR